MDLPVSLPFSRLRPNLLELRPITYPLRSRRIILDAPVDVSILNHSAITFTRGVTRIARGHAKGNVMEHRPCRTRDPSGLLFVLVLSISSKSSPSGKGTRGPRLPSLQQKPARRSNWQPLSGRCSIPAGFHIRYQIRPPITPLLHQACPVSQ